MTLTYVILLTQWVILTYVILLTQWILLNSPVKLPQLALQTIFLHDYHQLQNIYNNPYRFLCITLACTRLVESIVQPVENIKMVSSRPPTNTRTILVLSLSLVCASYSCQCCCADGVANDYPLLRCIYTRYIYA